jgi:non-specific serine/threonine protein kinase
VDRAQAVRPDFQVTAHNAAAVVTLCQWLEGLPLAIELAAARAAVLTPQQMLARLPSRFELLVGRQRGADVRHRSLWATLDWSNQLLSPALQRLFAQLSVFRGGWTVAAAESVCQEPSALECLEQLRESSFVATEESVGEMCDGMLETIREFAHERLAESEAEEGLRRRHAEFFLALVEAAAPELKGAVQTLWLDRLEREHDNLRAALAWSVGSGEPQIGLRLGGALQEFWWVRGYHKEGSAQLLRLLGQPGAEAHTAARARALSGAGRIEGFQGDVDTARALHEESLAIWRGLENRVGMAAALRYLGRLTSHQWNVGAGRALLEESLAICRELGDQQGIAQSLDALGWVVSAVWDLTAARAMVAESLAIWRELDDWGGIVHALDSLGIITFFQGEVDTARALFEEERARATELGDKTHVAWSLEHLGWVACCQDQFAAGRALYEQSLVLWRDLGDKAGLQATLFDLADAIRSQEDYRAGHAVYVEAVAVARRWRSNRAIAYSLADLGMAAGDLED